ncbi:Glutathione S-transferase TCHQD, partial [Linum grandiflorum]
QRHHPNTINPFLKTPTITITNRKWPLLLILVGSSLPLCLCSTSQPFSYSLPVLQEYALRTAYSCTITGHLLLEVIHEFSGVFFTLFFHNLVYNFTRCNGSHLWCSISQVLCISLIEFAEDVLSRRRKTTFETIMQLYHHAFSIDSQKVRLALEEKGIDYTSNHVNPITARNLDASFFRMNPSARLPVFQNGSHIIFETIEIIQYIERIAFVSTGANDMLFSNREVVEWMKKIQKWNPKFFTLSHVPDKYRLRVSKFTRRVLIARMAESSDLAGAYHGKLKETYETEEKLKTPEVVKRSTEHLVRLLDEVETKLGKTAYLAGEDFSLADVMLIPVLARLVLLNLEDEYIRTRPNMAQYWEVVKQRPSYRKVIGKYFNGWRRYKTMMKSWCLVHFRSQFKIY